MSRREDDEIEAFLSASRDTEVAREARHLSGEQVRLLRDAVAKSTKALRQLNTKGLPFAHRRDVEAARSALEDARRIVAKQHGDQRSTAGSTAAG